MEALVKEGQVKPVTPGDYIHKVPNFESAFIKMIDNNPLIQSRRGIALEQHQTFTLHIEKFSSLVYELGDMGLAREIDPPWFEMENLTADLYMAYLSSVLGNTEDLNMQPITDSRQSLSAYSAFTEKLSKPVNIFRDLRMRVIQGILPAPTRGIPVSDLVKFKNRHHRLLQRFRRHIESRLINVAGNQDAELRAKEAQIFEEELKEERGEILALMQKRRWPKIALDGVAAAMPVLGGIMTANPATALLGLPPLAYALYTAFSGNKEKQEAILSSPLAYAALAQRRFLTAKTYDSS